MGKNNCIQILHQTIEAPNMPHYSKAVFSLKSEMIKSNKNNKLSIRKAIIELETMCYSVNVLSNQKKTLVSLQHQVVVQTELSGTIILSNRVHCHVSLKWILVQRGALLFPARETTFLCGHLNVISLPITILALQPLPTCVLVKLVS